MPAMVMAAAAAVTHCN